MSRSTMDESVPVATQIDALYTSDALPSQKKRWDQLSKRFSDLYDGKSPDFVARSPGRVNLIGEHIDYSLYEVLPMAIAADVIIAVSTSKNTLKGTASLSIANVEGDKFKSEEFSFPLDGDVDIDASTHIWTNYFKAGLHGAMGLLRQKRKDFNPCSMQVLVDGNVPAGGGLSSSAAFVCASALAVLRASGEEEIIKKELVELSIVSERSVGVNSGGMDQAASVFSIRGDALSVSFSPQLHAEAIAFPKTDSHITFMIAQSFVAADKHVTAPECYNLRVVECTLAAEAIAAGLGVKLEDDSAPLGRSLHGLQNAYYNSASAPSHSESKFPEIDKLESMVSLVKKRLSSDSYTRDSIAQTLKTTVPSLEKRYMTKFPIRATHFRLRQRALHVFTEAIRVSKFKSLLQSPQPSTPDKGTALLQALGTLMNQTQDSCRDVYNCSCPELDELCTIAREAGSYGGRLTGAGWGGCTVHLVPKDKIDDVRRAWEEKYYRVRFPDITKEKLEEAVVVSEPGQGAMM